MLALVLKMTLILAKSSSMAKRLGDIVVRSGVKTGNFVHDRIPGSEHDDWYIRSPAQSAQDLQTIELRQHDVKQDQFIFAALRQGKSLSSIKRLCYFITLVG